MERKPPISLMERDREQNTFLLARDLRETLAVFFRKPFIVLDRGGFRQRIFEFSKFYCDYVGFVVLFEFGGL